MKAISVYLTVQVDVEVPDDMSYNDVRDMVCDLDYDFKFPSDYWNPANVIGTEICDVNEYPNI